MDKCMGKMQDLNDRLNKLDRILSDLEEEDINKSDGEDYISVHPKTLQDNMSHEVPVVGIPVNTKSAVEPMVESGCDSIGSEAVLYGTNLITHEHSSIGKGPKNENIFNYIIF